MSKKLRSSTNTPEINAEILTAAQEHFKHYQIYGNRIDTVWEHGQWWVRFDDEEEDSVRTFSVIDCADGGGNDYFNFEEV